MVGDREVIGILFRKLLEPDQQNGAILDGFPRTKVQVECLKMLFDEMIALRREFSATPEAAGIQAAHLPHHLLFVDEAESIARQMKRGQEVLAHNEEVRSSGLGDFVGGAAHRFRPRAGPQPLPASSRKKPTTHSSRSRSSFTTISSTPSSRWSWCMKTSSASSSTRVRSNSTRAPSTRLRKLPLASEIVRHARQDLVRRLDTYQVAKSRAAPGRVRIHRAKDDAHHHPPRHLRRADINTEDALFHDSEALAMLIDVFSERGFHATVDLHRLEIPDRFDLETGLIRCRVKKVFRINIRFKGSQIRRG